jgi:hypothetical protein
MKRSLAVIFMLAICLAVFIIAPGCIGRSDTGTPVQASPASPSTALQTPATQVYSATPGPVQTVPDYESISVTVQRNTITENPMIITTFNGGMGLGMTQRMDVTVIRSDGVVETGHRDNPAMGASVTLMGTTVTDRVIVVVTMTSGDQYTIIDQYYPFPGSGNSG